MIQITLRKLMLFSLIFLPAFVMSCDNETPDEQPVLNIEEYKASFTEVGDVGNNGDASDIQIRFSAGAASALVQEYRLILSKATSIANADLASVKALGTDQYTAVQGNQSVYTETLNAAQVDFDGDAVAEGTMYKLLILAVGTFNEETVYVLSEASNDVTMQVNAEISTLASGIQANDAISLDADGNLYVSNYGVWDQSAGKGNGSKVLKITSDGQVSDFVTGLSNPVGNTFDADGNFYVNDDNNFARGNLVKVSPDGTKSTLATIQGYPAGLLYGTDGNLYVSNYGRGVVSKVTPEGDITEFATDERLRGVVGIVYGNDGNIIVGNSDNGDILSIDPSGNVSFIARIPRVRDQGGLIGYLTYFEGNIYSTSSSARKVYKVTLAGEITDFAGSGSSGSSNGELLRASFIGPNGITVDEDKRVLYVSERITSGRANLRIIPIDQ